LQDEFFRTVQWRFNNISNSAVVRDWRDLCARFDAFTLRDAAALTLFAVDLNKVATTFTQRLTGRLGRSARTGSFRQLSSGRLF